MKKDRQQTHFPLAALLGGVASLLVLAGLYLWFLGGTNPATAQAVGGRFELQASTGQTVTDRSFRGRTLLIYFGYTSCQDICPTTLTAVTGALTTLGPKAASLQPIFITVDPARDTPDVLRRYLSAFTPRLIGLTGTQQQMTAVQTAYHIQTIIHPPRPGTSGYDVEHSSVLLLIGPDGHMIAALPADEAAGPLAADIAKYL
jgi:protein SCO1/2